MDLSPSYLSRSMMSFSCTSSTFTFFSPVTMSRLSWRTDRMRAESSKPIAKPRQMKTLLSRRFGGIAVSPRDNFVGHPMKESAPCRMGTAAMDSWMMSLVEGLPVPHFIQIEWSGRNFCPLWGFVDCDMAKHYCYLTSSGLRPEGMHHTSLSSLSLQL